MNLSGFTLRELKIVEKGLEAHERVTNSSGKWDMVRMSDGEIANQKLVCDNDSCEYEHAMPFSNSLKYINYPCPLCGDNLLTKEDFIRGLRMFIGIDNANRFGNWFMPKLPHWLAMRFYKKKADTVTFSCYEKITTVKHEKG